MYSKKYIKDFFLELNNNPHINTKKNLSWGYYFKCDNIKTLKKAERILISRNYDFSEIIQEDKMFYLHMEKIEKHDINSLYSRCVELTSLTKKLKIKSFDGFDAENIREHMI